MSALVRLNLELAQLEMKRKATALGIALALVVVILILALYAIGFALAAAAVGLSETVSLWLALLIVAGVTLLVGAVLALLAVRFARKASPPVPTQAIDETKRTVKTIRSHA
jgi:membrane protein implicated in regulation of membrane protease activity